MPQVTAGDKTFTYLTTDVGNKWFYHPDGTAKIAFESESEELYAQGFCDSPDDFDKRKPSEPIEDWPKEKMIDYALTIFGVKLKRQCSKETLIEKIKELEQNGNVQRTD